MVGEIVPDFGDFCIETLFSIFVFCYEGMYVLLLSCWVVMYVGIEGQLVGKIFGELTNKVFGVEF